MRKSSGWRSEKREDAGGRKMKRHRRDRDVIGPRADIESYVTEQQNRGGRRRKPVAYLIHLT